MQRAYDCDLVLVHDDDLERINGISEGSVSGHLIIKYMLLPMFAVTRISRTRSGDGSPPGFRHRDTYSLLW
jgi:hypothetical protein